MSEQDIPMIPDIERMSDERKILMLAHIAHLLTVSARGTYEPGTDKVLKPEMLRHFNELQHRVSASVWEHMMKSGGIPLETIVEMMRDFGLQNSIEREVEWILKTVTDFKYPEKI